MTHCYHTQLHSSSSVAAIHTMLTASTVSRMCFPGISCVVAAGLSERHAAVLGLQAFVQLSAYDVPPWLPGVLTALTSAAVEPAPIRTTVRSSTSCSRLLTAPHVHSCLLHLRRGAFQCPTGTCALRLCDKRSKDPLGARLR